MVEKEEEENEAGDGDVSFLPQDRDTLFNNDFKMKFEYGFKEKVKAAKLRGGNGPKQPKVKREKVIINCGGGGAAANNKTKKEKKEAAKAARKKGNKKNNNDEDSDDKEDEKKEVSKMTLNDMLGAPKPATGVVKDGTAVAAAAAAPMSMADRMKMMREKRDPNEEKKAKPKAKPKTDKPKTDKPAKPKSDKPKGDKAAAKPKGTSKPKVVIKKEDEVEARKRDEKSKLKDEI